MNEEICVPFFCPVRKIKDAVLEAKLGVQPGKVRDIERGPFLVETVILVGSNMIIPDGNPVHPIVKIGGFGILTVELDFQAGRVIQVLVLPGHIDTNDISNGRP